MTGLEVLDGEFDLNTMAEDEVETGSQQVGVMAHESGDKTTIYDVIIVGAGLAGKCQDISTHFEHFKLNRRPPSDITFSHIQNYRIKDTVRGSVLRKEVVKGHRFFLEFLIFYKPNFQ